MTGCQLPVSAERSAGCVDCLVAVLATKCKSTAEPQKAAVPVRLGTQSLSCRPVGSSDLHFAPAYDACSRPANCNGFSTGCKSIQFKKFSGNLIIHSIRKQEASPCTAQLAWQRQGLASPDQGKGTASDCHLGLLSSGR